MGEFSEYNSDDKVVSPNSPEVLGYTQVVAYQGYKKNYEEGLDAYLSQQDFQVINDPDTRPFPKVSWEIQKKAIEEAQERFGEVKVGLTMPYWGPLPSYTKNGKKHFPSEKVSIMVTPLYKGDKAYLVYTGSNDNDVVELNNFDGHVKRQSIGLRVADGRSAHLVKYLKEWETAARKDKTKDMREAWMKIQNGYKGIYDYSENPEIPPHLILAIKASNIDYIRPIGQR
jgi:hypothetical protein